MAADALVPVGTGRTLVLGGGGVAGIAWMTGVLYGLHENGCDVRGADRIIGTSAGSVVGAQLTSDEGVAVLYERQSDPNEMIAELSPAPGAFVRLTDAIVDGRELAGAEERARHIGAMAIAADTPDAEDRRNVIGLRLQSHDWAEDDRLRLIAVDCRSGEGRLFDRASGVELVDAVAASCAVPCIWPPVAIGTSLYMDGGVRSMDNLDLAAGAQRVLLISPGAGSAFTLGGTSMEAQRAVLGLGDDAFHLIAPDAASRTAFGSDPLDPATRGPSAEAGRAQGHAIAGVILQLFGDLPR